MKEWIKASMSCEQRRLEKLFDDLHKFILHYYRDERRDLPDDIRRFYGFKVDHYFSGWDFPLGKNYSARRKDAYRLTLEEAKKMQEEFILSNESKYVQCFIELWKEGIDMGEVINKKVLSKYFDEIVSGKKTYEVRKIEEGEEYIPGEYNFLLHEIDDDRNLTGRICRCKITSFLPAEEINEVCGECLADGYAIIGIRPVSVYHNENKR